MTVVAISHHIYETTGLKNLREKEIHTEQIEDRNEYLDEHFCCKRKDL
jgi:hypothetical protein